MLCCFGRKVRQDDELRADNDCRWKTGESTYYSGSKGGSQGFVSTNSDNDSDPYGLVPPPLFYLDSGDSTDTAGTSSETPQDDPGHQQDDNRKKGSRKYHYEYDAPPLRVQQRASRPAAKLDPNSQLQKKSKLHNEKLPSFSALDRSRKPRVRAEEASGQHSVEEEEAVNPDVYEKYFDDDGVGLVHKPVTFDTFRGGSDPRTPPLAVIAPLSSYSLCRHSDREVVRSPSPSGEEDFAVKHGDHLCDAACHLSNHQLTTTSLKRSPVIHRSDVVYAKESKNLERKSLPLLNFLRKATKDEYRRFLHGSSFVETEGRVNEGYSSDNDGTPQTTCGPSLRQPSSDRKQSLRSSSLYLGGSRAEVQQSQTHSPKSPSELASTTPKLNVIFPSADSLSSQTVRPGEPRTGVIKACDDIDHVHPDHLLHVPELSELTKERDTPTVSQCPENSNSGQSNTPVVDSPKTKKIPPKKPKRKNPPSNASTVESHDAIATCLANVTQKEAQSVMTSSDTMRPNDAGRFDLTVGGSKLCNILLAPPSCFEDQVYAGFDSFDEMNGSLV